VNEAVTSNSPAVSYPKQVQTGLREKVVKIGAKVIAHARYTVFRMAEVAVPRDLLRRFLAMIGKLRPRPEVQC
jgi:hypothetical protein